MFPLLVDSVSIAGIYALSALSWVMLYRTTRLMNLANGQFLLLGTYLFASFLVQFGLPFPVALLASGAAIAIIGAAVYATMLRRLEGQGEFTIVILTLGLAAVITSLTTMIWGDQDRVLPATINDRTFHLPLSATITTYDIVVIVATIVLVGLASLFIDHLPFGLSMRAAAENPVLASQTGIRVGRVLAAGWALSLVAATLSGIAYSYVNVLSPDISEQLGLLGLAPAFVGGLDSIPGALVGGLIVALCQSFAGSYISAGSQDAVAWILMLLFLLLRPQGVLGSKRIERV
jgi:branched-chain amino acid transport system permease protein